MIFYLYFTYNEIWNNKNMIKLNCEKNINILKTDNNSASEYAYIYKLFKSYQYKLPFDDIFDIFTFISKNKNIIDRLENIYKYKFNYLRKFSNYIILSNTDNIFINDNDDSVTTFENIIKYELPILGIKLIKCYNLDEIIKINNYNLLSILKNNKQIEKNNLLKFNNFLNNI